MRLCLGPPSTASAQWFGSIASGNTDMIDARLRDGQNVNQRAIWGRTGLHLAAEAGRVVSVQKLIEAGAKLNIADHIDGETPLHLAAYKGQVEALRLLIIAGANVQFANFNGRTAYDLALRADVRRTPQKRQVIWLLEQAGGGHIPRGLPLVLGSMPRHVEEPIVPVLLGASANALCRGDAGAPVREDSSLTLFDIHAPSSLTSGTATAIDAEKDSCLVALCPHGICAAQGETLRLCVEATEYAVVLHPQIKAGDYFYVQLPTRNGPSPPSVQQNSSATLHQPPALFQPGLLSEVDSLAERLERSCSVDRRSARRCAAALTARGFPRCRGPPADDALSAVENAEALERVQAELCRVQEEFCCTEEER